MAEDLKPCPACPIITWGLISAPGTVEGERAIRADQRRLDLRELQATVRDLRWLIDRIIPEDEMTDEPGNVVVSIDTLDQIRRHSRQFVTQSERRIRRLEAA